MGQTAVIIGTFVTCQQLEQQLTLLPNRPRSTNWIVVDYRQSLDPIEHCGNTVATVTAHPLTQLETVISQQNPSLALVALPSAMHELITSIRTRLRRLGVPDRFMPTLEDQLAGIGPRTNIEIDLAALLNRPPRKMDEHAIRTIVSNTKLLITGAGGSIGSELARIVARYQPSQLLLMDRSENALFEIDRQIARFHPNLPRQALLHDVVDADATCQLLQKLRPQLIFHAAAHKHVPMMEDHPAAAVTNNFFGTKSIADAAHATGVERFVFISTDKAVNPISIMGATKRLAELYVHHINQRSQTAFSIVRFGNVLGSSGSVLEIWSKQIADGGPITVTDPAMTRYFMTIPEAATLVIQSAALIEHGGEVFLLDMGQPVRIVDLAQRFAKLHGVHAFLPDSPPPTKNTGTIPIVFTARRPGEKLHEELTFDAESMKPTSHPEINIWCLDPPDSRYMEQAEVILAQCRTNKPPQQIARTVRRLLEEAACSGRCLNLTDTHLMRE